MSANDRAYVYSVLGCGSFLWGVLKRTLKTHKSVKHPFFAVPNNEGGPHDVLILLDLYII